MAYRRPPSVLYHHCRPYGVQLNWWHCPSVTQLAVKTSVPVVLVQAYASPAMALEWSLPAGIVRHVDIDMWQRALEKTPGVLSVHAVVDRNGESRKSKVPAAVVEACLRLQ